MQKPKTIDHGTFGSEEEFPSLRYIHNNFDPEEHGSVSRLINSACETLKKIDAVADVKFRNTLLLTFRKHYDDRARCLTIKDKMMASHTRNFIQTSFKRPFVDQTHLPLRRAVNKMLDRVDFHKSKLLKTHKALWTLAAVRGRAEFESALVANNYRVDEKFVKSLLAESDRRFFVSHDKQMVFGSRSKYAEKSFSPLTEVSATEAAEIFTVPQLASAMTFGQCYIR